MNFPFSPQFYLGQSIQDWTKENFWKAAFKKLKGYGLPKAGRTPSNFLKAVYQKFYLVDIVFVMIVLFYHNCITLLSSQSLVSNSQFYLGQSIQDWTKENFWKAAFKKLKGYGLPKAGRTPSNFLKAVYQKFYLVDIVFVMIVLFYHNCITLLSSYIKKCYGQ